MEPSTIDSLKKYLNLIIKKKVLFVAIATLIITASVIISYALPKKYEARTTVFIERK